MKSNFTQKEILLVTGTGFLTREFHETIDGQNCNHLTEKEKLKVACWKGHLPKMLPEIFDLHSVTKKLYLWEMREGPLFIELKSVDTQIEVEMQFSIDPYSFLPLQIVS